MFIDICMIKIFSQKNFSKSYLKLLLLDNVYLFLLAKKMTSPSSKLYKLCQTIKRFFHDTETIFFRKGLIVKV